jgi:hypothetical protein
MNNNLGSIRSNFGPSDRDPGNPGYPGAFNGGVDAMDEALGTGKSAVPKA